MLSIHELLKKYNNPVPRYTSYPPANYFKEGFSGEAYTQALKESNAWLPENMSFYIHIPFCKKMCFYCGCNSCPMGETSQTDRYMEALKSEIKFVGQYLNKDRKVSQIHYGGGTPNSIPAGYLAEINNLFYSEFKFINNPEIAIECNPAYLDDAYIDSLKKAGFNRFSLGIQDFNHDVLSAVNRDPSAIPVDELIAKIKEGKKNITVNLDFIYGLPGQTEESFSNTIKQAIKVKPDRLVTFSYAHVPWFNKTQKILEKRGLPSPEEKVNMFLKAHGLLVSGGYKSIGLDHYVLKNDELYTALQNQSLHRNFQGYCTRRTTGQVYAFGVSAISQLEKSYIQNTKSVKDYIEIIGEERLPVIKGYTLNNDEVIVREVIQEFMCNKQLEWASLAQQLNISETDLKNRISLNDIMLNEFQDDGIIMYSDQGITLQDIGSLFIRNVAASLDPLLLETKNKYSKSV